MRTRLVVAVLVAAAVLGMWAPEANAGGGTTLDPVSDRYEVGETATLIGYAAPSSYSDPDITDWSDTGPFHGYLRDARYYDQNHTAPGLEVLPDDIPLGAPDLEWVGDYRGTYGPVRVSLTFEVPSVPAGDYVIFLCNDPCTQWLGSVLESGVSIGADPAEPYVRFWPADEPAIAELDDAALIQPPNASSPMTAARLRSQKALHRPDSEPDPDVETAATCLPDCGETAANSGSGRGAALGLALLGAGSLAVLWFFAVRTGPSRKRVTSGSATAEQTKWDVRSDPPKPIRL